MAKVTTIIDIGSNSMRMVVFKKTSRFAFHLINESKSKVKISQGCYENNGNLQPIPMQRAFEALKSFLQIAKNLKSRKILCVATSALRDAPNKKLFITKVSKELKLNIKVIDGTKEAYFGGMAALNLLTNDDFTTIDIGGGSTEFCFIQNKNIQHTISLKIGTVRIKELYFARNDFKGAKKYIIDEIKQNEDCFINNKQLLTTMVGLGGTIRALSRIILANDTYPLDSLHGFKYKLSKYKGLFDNIIDAKSSKELKNIGVEKDRYDTIAVGTFIFKTIVEYFTVKEIVTSVAGVREGVYLNDILRTSNGKFPVNFNIGVRSLLDRFVDDQTQTAYLGANASKIFTALQPLHNLDTKYKSILVIASKLQLIGVSLNFDKKESNTFWYILNGLNYSCSHQDKVLIAIVAKFTKKSLPTKKDIKKYKSLLPNIEIVRWLNFMMTLNISLNSEFSKTLYNYKVENNKFLISSGSKQYLVQRALQKIQTPIDLIIEQV